MQGMTVRNQIAQALERQGARAAWRNRGRALGASEDDLLRYEGALTNMAVRTAFTSLEMFAAGYDVLMRHLAAGKAVIPDDPGTWGMEVAAVLFGEPDANLDGTVIGVQFKALGQMVWAK